MSLATKTTRRIQQFYRFRQIHKNWPRGSSYESEADLENELIKDLSNQGYDFLSDLNSRISVGDLKKQLEELNKIEFSNSEWNRFCEEYLDDQVIILSDKTRKIHDDYIYDFTFDNGTIKNIYLLWIKNIAK